MSAEKLDLLAVDLTADRLVVIELKSSQEEARRHDPAKGGDALAQAERYADALYRSRGALYPFFERLARAMAKAHDAPRAIQELRLHTDERPLARVASPGGGI